jgi:hypothetical protein
METQASVAVPEENGVCCALAHAKRLMRVSVFLATVGNTQAMVAFYSVTQEYQCTGCMTVYTSAQGPANMRALLVKVLKCQAHKLNVVTKRVGGAFGCKITRYISPLPSFLALFFVEGVVRLVRLYAKASVRGKYPCRVSAVL